MTIAIIIPARYASTRFPGKPLANLNGKAVLHHVYDVAVSAAANLPNVSVHITTDDTRISDYCAMHEIPTIMTVGDYQTGTDRVMAAAHQLPSLPDFIVNLQGDAPLTPPDFVAAIIKGHHEFPASDIITPVVQLSWDELDFLRISKETTPFSGTTAIVGDNGQAIWFSKNIIPAIRKEESLRKQSELSPVYRHIGLYGYKWNALQTFVATPPSQYEELEGLEQLRALEAGLTIQAIHVNYNGLPAMTGIDSPEDLVRAEFLLQKH
ncbi:MAG: 3-deoxy-manno-octulosonate cytidylyltransferase [Pseudomonadota bacterium]